MGILTLQRTNARLTCAPISWQKAAISLLVLSAAVNVILMNWISRQETRYREQIEAVQHVRDLAVQELGAMSLRLAAEQQAREAQAEAYAAAGGYRYIGECTITAYCCEAYEHICGTGDGITATGLPVAPGLGAVDPDVIPLGSTVVIDGQKYLAADTGVTGLCVDVAVPTHDEALEQGIRTANVWIEAEGSVEHDYD